MGLNISLQGMGAAVGDYDNDSRPDLYLTALGPNHLFHNNGNGTFSDVTRKAGVGDRISGYDEHVAVDVVAAVVMLLMLGDIARMLFVDRS